MFVFVWTGTTSSCAFDPVLALAQVCKNEALGNDLWLHIDAAYGGAYACLPELATKFQGIELADSFCVNWYVYVFHPGLFCIANLVSLPK